jgi:hypothetical protein
MNQLVERREILPGGGDFLDSLPMSNNCIVHDTIPSINDIVYDTIHAHDTLIVMFNIFD